MSESIYDVPVKKITGEESSLKEYKGKVLLVVNVASKCGLTKQYSGLEALYEKYKDKGLIVAGFPANDFKGQEPGSNEEIQTFCTGNFGVQFPMFEKIVVTGANKHPLYALLTTQSPAVQGDPDGFRTSLQGHGIETTHAPEVLWNFEKFLIGKDGAILARFAPNLVPESELITSAVEKALAN